jgi:hypothetical protein
MPGCKCNRCRSKTYIEPYKPNVPCKPKPAGKALCDNGDLFACWAAEHIKASGTEIDYWWQDLNKAILDPLYNEPDKRVWTGPVRLMAYVKWPEQQYEVTEQGSHAIFPSEAWLPRLLVEASEMTGFPKEGDVLQFWNIPFFEQYGLDGDLLWDIPNAGYFFDIINVNDDAHFLDRAEFAGFKLTLKRRTEFTPERRVLNET